MLQKSLITLNTNGQYNYQDYRDLPELDLVAVNQELSQADAYTLVKWGYETFKEGLVMSTSFGIQAAVMLHLVSSVVPNIPIIWIDTGYLPVETYKFAEELIERLKLNIKIYQSPMSSGRMEALHGRLWAEKDVDALNRYNEIRKVEPMQRALKELKATAWLAGLRGEQTKHRQSLDRISKQSDTYKILPILSWSARDIYQYLTAHDLPYHPFFDLGYTTVGDWHSSRPLTADDIDERDTRFHGLKQECGLHLPQTQGKDSGEIDYFGGHKSLTFKNINSLDKKSKASIPLVVK
jgi:phosphoadenosine phosphosulfate reductase